jgi:hypothetical protein
VVDDGQVAEIVDPVAANEAALRALWEGFKATGDGAVRERLILHYSPLVKYVAGRVGVGLPPNIEQADLVSYGIFGLIDAIEKFDHGHHPCRTGRHEIGEVGPVLMQLDPPDPGQDSVPGLAAERPGREPDRRARLALGLEPGEPDRFAFPLALAGAGPVLQGASETVQAGVERLFRVLTPPWATAALAWFQSLRSEYSVHDRDGVRSASGTP